jgi:phage shock protein A
MFMNLLERVLTLLGANLNTVIEKTDEPEKVLRQLQLDLHNQLVQVKTQVATAIAESHKLQRRSKEKLAEADVWFKKAQQAVRQNNDESARAALGRYNDILRLAKRYDQLRKDQEQLVVTMRGALRQLEAKIAEVETTVELLETRKRNALIQQRMYDALNKTASPKDKERTLRAQDAVLEAEARARALAELHQRGLDVDLDQLSEEQVIERQLSELRAKQQPTSKNKGEVPLLHEGMPQASPLIPPQPQADSPVRKQVERKPGTARAGQEGASSLLSAHEELSLTELKQLME